MWIGREDKPITYEEIKAGVDRLMKGMNMPHDKNGQLLKVGDKVSVEFEVAEVYAGEDYCNVRLQVPGENKADNVTTGVTLNTRQTTKLS